MNLSVLTRVVPGGGFWAVRRRFEEAFGRLGVGVWGQSRSTAVDLLRASGMGSTESLEALRKAANRTTQGSTDPTI